MIAGHLDEIGFMITKIDDNGFIRFTQVGSWWNQVMLSQKVTITTDEGRQIQRHYRFKATPCTHT